MNKLQVKILTDLVRQSNAARTLGISRQRIHWLVANGKLTVYEIDGLKFVSKQEIEARQTDNVNAAS